MNQPDRFQIIAFKPFVPHPVRIALLVLFTVIFQCSNTVYPTLTGTLVGANQLVKEDLTFAYQLTMTGICFVFPLLFRFKLRFTSQQIIIGTALLITAIIWIGMHTNSVPLLALISFVLGAAKMLGTFEALTSIQLIITPNKDYGVFFSVALGVVLLCGQLSGIWAVYLTYDYDWTVIYKLLMVANAVMILLTLLLFRNSRIAKKLPLYGIDWLGLFLWSSLFISLTYVFAYGQLLNWWQDERIQLALTLSIAFSLLTLIRLFNVRRPYISTQVFALKNVWIAILLMFLLQIFLGTSGSVLSPFTSGVLHLDELTNSSLNGWVSLGILVGAGFSYQWFLRINGPFSLFFGIAFLALTLYHLAIYFVLSSYADASVMSIPYWLRGFGQMLLFAGTAKYVTNQIGMGIFTQVLCFMAMIRNSLGSLIPSSLMGIGNMC